MNDPKLQSLILVARFTRAENRIKQLKETNTEGEATEKKAISKMISSSQNEIASCGTEFLRAHGFTSKGLKPKERIKKNQVQKPEVKQIAKPIVID